MRQLQGQKVEQTEFKALADASPSQGRRLTPNRSPVFRASALFPYSSLLLKNWKWEVMDSGSQKECLGRSHATQDVMLIA